MYCHSSWAAGWNGHIVLSHLQDKLLNKLQCFFPLSFLALIVSFLMAWMFLKLNYKFMPCLGFFFPPCRDTSACITGNRFGWKAAIEFAHNADTRAGQYTEVALQMVVNKAKEGNTWTFPKIKLFVLANWDLRGRKNDWNIQVYCGLEILAFVHFCALQKIVWTTKPGSHFIPYINLLFVILIVLFVAIQHIPKYLVVN